jgi:hypothetical protein
MINLCVTCSHFELNPDSKDPEHGLCNRIPSQLSPVTGLPVSPPTNFARVERLPHQPCGIGGKLHNPKEEVTHV